MKNPKSEQAVFIMADWLGKCLHDIKQSGLISLHWHPPSNPLACGAGASHMPMRDGGYCTAAWTLISALRPKEGRISLDAACRLLRALHAQADICGVFKSWRNKLMRELALLLQLRVRKLPFVSRPSQAILDWHLARGSNGKHKDHDEDLDLLEEQIPGLDNDAPASPPRSPSNTKEEIANDEAAQLAADAHLQETQQREEQQRQSIIKQENEEQQWRRQQQ